MPLFIAATDAAYMQLCVEPKHAITVFIIFIIIIIVIIASSQCYRSDYIWLNNPRFSCSDNLRNWEEWVWVISHIYVYLTKLLIPHGSVLRSISSRYLVFRPSHTLFLNVASFTDALLHSFLNDLARPDFQDDTKGPWSHKQCKYTLVTISGDT